ncbi:MAG: hypothetical protein K0R67_2458 [Paenibacillus sp.]|jgi:hypothetical protein|nr:hypothetical protein [Paenibacillus sp.]
MAIIDILNNEQFHVSVDDVRNHIQIECSSTGYRPKYVSVFVESYSELDEIIAALTRAREYLVK